MTARHFFRQIYRSGRPSVVLVLCSLQLFDGIASGCRILGRFVLRGAAIRDCADTALTMTFVAAYCFVKVLQDAITRMLARHRGEVFDEGEDHDESRYVGFIPPASAREDGRRQCAILFDRVKRGISS